MQELLRSISSRELTEWMCYFALEPWGEERADLRMGILASLTAEIHRDKKQRQEPFRAVEFMPYHHPELEKPRKKNSPKTEAFYTRLLMEMASAKAKKAEASRPPSRGISS